MISRQGTVESRLILQVLANTGSMLCINHKDRAEGSGREYEDGTTLKGKGRKDFTDNRTRKNWLGC